MCNQEDIKKLANIVSDLLKAIEDTAKKCANDIIPQDEIDDIYFKQVIEKDMSISMQIYNSKTKTKIIKFYPIFILIELCSNNLIDHMLKMDIKEFYDKSKKNIYQEITEVIL